MATTKPAVRIPVKLDTKEAKKEAQNFGKEMKRSFLPVVDVVQAARMAFDMARAALGQLTGLTKEAIALAAEQERVEQRVMTVANMRAEFTKKDFDLLQRQNAARQQALGIGDEEQLLLQSSALMLNARAENLSELTELSIGLSRATGKNLARSMRQVMAIQAGEITTLKSMGIQVKDVSEAIEVLSRMYGDAAAQTGTYAQMTDTLTANWGDLLEEFGRTVVENEDVKDFIQDLSDAVIGFASYVKENRTEISGGISEMVHSLRALGNWIKEHRTEIGILSTLFAGAVALKGAKLLGLGKLIGAGRLAAPLLATPLGAGVAGAGLLAAGRPSISRAEARASVGDIGSGISLGELKRAAARGEVWATMELNRRGITDHHEWQGPPTDPGVERFDFSESDTGGLSGVIRVNRAEARKRERDAKRKAQAAKRAADRKQRDLWAERGESYKRKREESRRRRRREDAAGSPLPMSDKDAWANARADWQDQQKQGETEFWADMAQLGVQGVSQLFGGIASAVAQQQSVGEVLQKVFSDMLTGLGGMLISMGSAALLANTSATLIPFLWPYTGGPPGVGAALGIIAAGTALTAGGMLTAPSSPAGGAAAASRQVRRDATRSRRTDRPMIPGAGEAAPVGVVINFHQPVGSPRRTARAIADVMNRGRTLAPGYGG